MISRASIRWIIYAGAIGAALALTACSSSKPYALSANLTSGGHLVVATIDVANGNCSVRMASLDWNDFYKPDCSVLKDQSGFKSFKIGGTQVDFGAVDTGFKVLGTPPALPGVDPAAAPAAGTKAAAKPAAAAPAASTAAAPAAAGQAFPSEWVVDADPGQQHLVGQNPGFLLTSNKLMVSGADCMLDVTFKATYKPWHMGCIATADIKGNFRFVFLPRSTGALTGGGNYDVQFVSEGTGISGVIWDSHGFDSWTPDLPVQWTTSSDTAQ